MGPVELLASAGVIAGVEFAAGEITGGNWLTFVGGLLVGSLTISATIGIAWRQRVFEIRDRAVERAAQEQREREERERQARIGKQESWKDKYKAIGELLDLGDTIVGQVIDDGPRTAAELSTLRLADFKRKAIRLAERGIETLKEPLTRLAALAESLAKCAVPDSEAMVAAYKAAARTPVPDNLDPRAVQVLAIEQYRITLLLKAELDSAWQALETEWGS